MMVNGEVEEQRRRRRNFHLESSAKTIILKQRMIRVEVTTSTESRILPSFYRDFQVAKYSLPAM